MLIERLDAAIQAVCPIHGVSVLDDAKHAVRIDFKDEATAEQRAAAEAVVAGFDWDATPPRTLWPYEFQALLTDDQLTAIQLATAPMLIRMRTKIQTILSPMPFDESSELYRGVLLLGQAIPDLFTPSEVARILAAQPPE